MDSDSSPSQLSVREGVRVSLICRAQGVPAPRVIWKREDGRPLIESSPSGTKLMALEQQADMAQPVIKRPGNLNLKLTSSMSRNPHPPPSGEVVGGSRMIIAQDGEELTFPKISRTDSAAYLCIASNGVPPSVSKRIILDVECESCHR